MALNVICSSGHSYIAADIYDRWPDGCPHCPQCATKWAEQNGIKYQWLHNGEFIKFAKEE